MVEDFYGTHAKAAKNAKEASQSEINNFRKQVKGQNFNDVDTGIYNYQLGVYYMDFISECEKLGDYLMNVDQAGLSKNNDHDDKPMRR